MLILYIEEKAYLIIFSLVIGNKTENMVAFPILKLLTLAVLQISQPLAHPLKIKAKKSLFFRTYICMPPAQFYHWVEEIIKMRMQNIGISYKVQTLDENMAIQLGADVLKELCIFLVAVLTLTAEYRRTSRNEKAKQAATEDLLRTMAYDIADLKFITNFQKAELTPMYLSVDYRLLSTQKNMKRRKIITYKIKDNLFSLKPETERLLLERSE